MSSHHFVKDGQEPALIIANGERCSQELLNQLLEWCPFVLVLDGALQDVLNKGIAINAVSGDFDSEPLAAEKVAQLDQVEVFYTPNQNYTDLEKGIDICIEKGHQNVNIIWGTGRRTDHIIGNLDLIVKLKNKVNLVFWDDFLKIYLAPSGFKKWFNKGHAVSLVPWPSCAKVDANNLVWPLNHLDLEMAQQLSTCNKIAEDGFLEIKYGTGDLLLMEALVLGLANKI